jgi:hypothetical protein
VIQDNRIKPGLISARRSPARQAPHRAPRTRLFARAALALVGALLFTQAIEAAPVVYTNAAAFRPALTSLDTRQIHESFEDNTVWAASRNSIVAPGNTPVVTSQGITWTSNHAQNNIATGSVGGSAPDGLFAIYSLPHGVTNDSGSYCDSAEDPKIPEACYQNDGLKVTTEDGEALDGFGGRIDSANSGKVTFILDGVDINGNDTDSVDNVLREGKFADGSAFVGVIDGDGLFVAELRE